MRERVLILMGSESDETVMAEAAKLLAKFGVAYRMTVASAHRTPDRVEELIGSARADGYGVIIAGAGMAAHLAGVCAGRTTLPVIGVPLSGSKLVGVDALLATVQMPPGIPVATVGIDGAKNAALLAVQILAVGDPELARLLDDDRAVMAKRVEEMAQQVEARSERTLGG
jgi:phosphoribosylaminoimidazole carboxylase PurE protein